MLLATGSAKSSITLGSSHLHMSTVLIRTDSIAQHNAYLTSEIRLPGFNTVGFIEGPVASIILGAAESRLFPVHFLSFHRRLSKRHSI